MVNNTISKFLQQFMAPSHEDLGAKTRNVKQQQWFDNVIDNIVEEITALYEEYEKKSEHAGGMQQMLGMALPMILPGPLGAILTAMGSQWKDEDLRQTYEDKIKTLRDKTEGTFLEDYTQGAFENIEDMESGILTGNLMGLASSLAVPQLLDWGKGPFTKQLPVEDIIGIGEGPLAPGSFRGPYADPAEAFVGDTITTGSWLPQFSEGKPFEKVVSKGREEISEIIPGTPGTPDYMTQGIPAQPPLYGEVQSLKPEKIDISGATSGLEDIYTGDLQVGTLREHAYENWAALPEASQKDLLNKGVNPWEYETNLRWMSDLEERGIVSEYKDWGKGGQPFAPNTDFANPQYSEAFLEDIFGEEIVENADLLGIDLSANINPPLSYESDLAASLTKRGFPPASGPHANILQEHQLLPASVTDPYYPAGMHRETPVMEAQYSPDVSFPTHEGIYEGVNLAQPGVHSGGQLIREGLPGTPPTTIKGLSPTPARGRIITPGTEDVISRGKQVDFQGFNKPSFKYQQPSIDILGGLLDKVGGAKFLDKPWAKALKGIGQATTPYWGPYMMGTGYAQTFPQTPSRHRPVNPMLMRRYRP